MRDPGLSRGDVAYLNCTSGTTGPLKGAMNTHGNIAFNARVYEKMQRIDFITSGHSHGGQLVLPYMGGLYVSSPLGQKYRECLVRDGDRQTYISKGLGLFFVPIRLNCPPDVSMLTLSRP